MTKAIQQDNASGNSLIVGASSTAMNTTNSNDNDNGTNVNNANGMMIGKLSQRRQVNAHYENLRNEITDVHMVMRKNL